MCLISIVNVGAVYYMELSPKNHHSPSCDGCAFPDGNSKDPSRLPETNDIVNRKRKIIFIIYYQFWRSVFYSNRRTTCRP
ncbi:hypothetical protein CDAR_544911 [Caerostris darwini]|uniref:Secreted protein n=1 Tax=Caerostris darwini TaxID=1538125 RepID=A0AAV4PYL1_9ARAC|nr:hypothetical protein CDAR_544911 [Caerostris darwini]